MSVVYTIFIAADLILLALASIFALLSIRALLADEYDIYAETSLIGVSLLLLSLIPLFALWTFDLLLK